LLLVNVCERSFLIICALSTCCSVGIKACSCIGVEALCSACCLIELLGNLVELLLKSVLLLLDSVDAVALESFLEVSNLCVDFVLVCFVKLVCIILEKLFCLEYDLICTVADVNLFLTLLVFLSKLLSFLNCALDIILAHI
jgi:hypothetical protein